MSTPLRYPLLPFLVPFSFLLVSLGSPGCSSGDKKSERDGVTAAPTPALQVEPTTGSGGGPGAVAACPGSTPAETRVRVSNAGDAEATLSYRFEGAGKDAFSVSEGSAPATLAPGGFVDVLVHFTPSAPGTTEATLLIDDGVEGTPPLTVSLTGTGLDLPKAPVAEIRVASAQGGEPEPCDVFGLCRLAYPPTFFGQAQTLEVHLNNGGCTPLEVSGLALTKGAAGGGNLAFFVEKPALLPSGTAPWVISPGAPGGTVIQIRFQPERDADDERPGNAGSSYREGILRLSTNDPAAAELAISLSGEATEPATYAVPERCDFSDVNDPCGYPTKTENQARFRVFNAGGVEARITAEFATRGQERFALVSPLVDALVPANGFIDVDVRDNGAPGSTYVAERLVVRATVNGAPAGETFIELGGGAPPKMSTEPVAQVDFSQGTQTEVLRSVTLSNAEGAGTLVIDGVSIDDTRYFSLVDPPPPGTTVAQGRSLTLQLRYRKPAGGGTQAAVLRIQTNDPSYAAPAYKVLTLYSETPLDQVPVAAVQVRAQGTTDWSDGPYTQSLAGIDGPDKRLELSCHRSQDPGPASVGPKRVQRCEFRLVKKPRLATQTSLDFDGERIEAYPEGEPVVVRLRLTPNVVGQYQVDVYVYDDAGQRSSQPARLLIHAVQ